MPTIVKVEMPVSFPMLLEVISEAPAVVYAKGGRNQQHVPITDDLRGAMAGKLKAYFFAEQGPSLEWVLIRPAPWQGW